MYTFWTADCHFGHENIIKYCNRPFANKEEMHKRIIANWNQRVQDGDVVVHIGDWCCRGNERGVPGGRVPAEFWEQQVRGKIIFIEGNHDRNNGLRFYMRSAVMDVGPYRAFVVHVPPIRLHDIPEDCDIVLCGHVHERWRFNWVDDIPLINVGVDANGFMPQRKDDIVNMVLKLKAARALHLAASASEAADEAVTEAEANEPNVN